MDHLLAAIVLIFSALVGVLARPSYEDDRSRSMSSWSGWMPGSGMSMFASSQGDDPWAMQPSPIWRMDDEGYPRPLERENPVAKKQPKKKGYDGEDADDDSGEHGGSRANASFNAWFPIMLGMYPGAGDDNGSRGASRPGRPSSEREGGAAIANSVNHGRNGVASSHAIVYSGEPENSFRRTPPAQQQYSRPNHSLNEQHERSHNH